VALSLMHGQRRDDHGTREDQQDIQEQASVAGHGGEPRMMNL
jgi:hypothetical protein